MKTIIYQKTQAGTLVRHALTGISRQDHYSMHIPYTADSSPEPPKREKIVGWPEDYIDWITPFWGYGVGKSIPMDAQIFFTGYSNLHNMAVFTLRLRGVDLPKKSKLSIRGCLYSNDDIHAIGADDQTIEYYVSFLEHLSKKQVNVFVGDVHFRLDLPKPEDGDWLGPAWLLEKS